MKLLIQAELVKLFRRKAYLLMVVILAGLVGKDVLHRRIVAFGDLIGRLDAIALGKNILIGA